MVEAAAVAGVSTPTIRRRRAALLEAGATDDPKGWRIPHSALVAAGFTADWSAEDTAGEQEPLPEPEPAADPEPPAETPQEHPTTDEQTIIEESPTERIRAMEDRLRRVESENLVLRHEVDKWQTVARERLNALNAERVALHALSIYHEQPRQIEQAPAQDKPEAPKRGWWSRTFG